MTTLIVLFNLKDGKSTEEYEHWAKDKDTTPRIMNTDEMARAVMFLASDEATSVTGMDLDVTGGFLAGQK